MRRMFSKKQLEEISLEKIEATENLKIFENIVDKDGHKRFIEGDITMEEISGITQTYCKWSLSGSHLLVVIGGSVANGTTISSTTKICDIDFPQWIKDKIEVLYGASVVLIESVSLYGSDGVSQTGSFRLRKADNAIFVDISGNLTLTADRNFRIQYDLLIDNE